MEGNQTLDNFNTDLRLIYSLSAHKQPVDWAKPKTMQELTALLKLKNKTNEPQHPEHLERGRQWLSKKGVNLEPLLTRLAYHQKTAKHPSQSTAADNYFHVALSEASLPEYLQKAEEYANMSLMQSIMGGGNFRRKFISKAIEDSLSLGPNRFPVWECENQKERRSTYIGLVKAVAERRLDRTSASHELLKEFRSAMTQLGDDFLWEILCFQLEAYSPSVPLHVNLTRMFVTSLKLIQQEFQKRLHGIDFERFLSRQYIARAEGRWPFEHGGFWAKVWLYYCLGMKQEVIGLLSSEVRDFRDLCQLYIVSEEALNHGKPIRQQYSPRYEVEDIFFEQFVFNITGQSRYSCELMTDPLSLELISIVVRTLGIFCQTEREKLEQVRAGLVRSYRDSTSDPQVIRNILYLLDYDEVVRLGPNAIMSGSDYLHFLIVLSGFKGVANQSKLQTILCQQLVQFILELLAEHRAEYIYYVSLLPQKRLVNEVSALILSADALDSFDWKGVKSLIKEELYEELVYSTVEKYRLRERGELRAARKLIELLGDQEKAFEYLLTLMINHYLHRCKYQKEDVLKAEELGSSWSKEKGVSKVYQQLFDFLGSLRLLLSLLVKRNEQLLRSFVSSCEFIVLDVEGSSNSMNLRMLELMGEENGLQLYFYYLRLVVKGAEIYASRAAEAEKLASLKRMLRQLVESIERSPTLRIQSNSPHLTTLKEELSDPVL